jgi:hypothetical protein
MTTTRPIPLLWKRVRDSPCTFRGRWFQQFCDLDVEERSKNVRNNSLQLKQRTNPADPRRHSYGTTVFNQEQHSESLVLGLGFRRDSPFDPDYEDVETEQLFIMYPRIGEHDYSY